MPERRFDKLYLLSIDQVRSSQLMTGSHELSDNLLTDIYKCTLHMMVKTFEPLVELVPITHACVGSFAREIWNLQDGDDKDRDAAAS
ncbi:hypothetical protein CPC16_009611 [Podila verticillata]|nr:hypothetical protein CPC16_009611 [Podila verticillata]